MNDTDQILKFFESHPEQPWHLQDIQRQLKVKDRAALKRKLDELTQEGTLIRTRKRTYGVPQEMNLKIGVLQVTSGGYGFVLSEVDGEEDLFIPADFLEGAWDGDKVVARPNPQQRDQGRISGKIVRILERHNNQIVGTLEYAKGYAILRPDSVRLRQRVLLLPDTVGSLEEGTRLVADLVWPEDSGEKEAFAKVSKVLGQGDDPEIELQAVIIKYDLKDSFDDTTLAEANAVPPQVGGEMLEGRTDLRGIHTFTIDGEDAKDFDDAISLERLGKGNKSLLRVGIHIADVSYYVAEGTSLDREAKERATSVYLPGHVLPMLPEALSNGICSLVEGEARLCLSVMVDLTREAEVKKVQFKETIIQSDARLTYNQVQDFAEGGRLPQGKRKLERDIKQLLGLSQKLRAIRIGAGALDFNLTEARVDVDQEGTLHVVPISTNVARQLIEEKMLLANRLVAEELSKRDIPVLYRIHEDPTEERIGNLQRALARLGYTLNLENVSPKDLQEILKQAVGKPEARLVNTLTLRSLKQARYSPENLGHFGLAFDNYLHFTSPIRRYPDLVVHRMVRAMLQRRLSPTLKARLRTDFPALGEHTSKRERNAEQAERDLTRYFHTRWAAEHLGENFSATISGVTQFGLFVSLFNGVEGMLHVSHLDDDYYTYLEDSLMLLGKSTRKRYRLGDSIEVTLAQANPTARQIDFVLKGQALPEAESKEIDLPEMPEAVKLKDVTKVKLEPSQEKPQTTPAKAKPSQPKQSTSKPAQSKQPTSKPAQPKPAQSQPKPATQPPNRPQIPVKKRRILVFGDPKAGK